MDKDRVRKLQKPDGSKVIYFYMEGCPYCEKTDPHWDYVKKQGHPYKFYKIERDEIPDDLAGSIRGFPQFHIIENSKVRVVEGSKESGKELDGALQLGRGKAYRGGRRTRRRRRTVRK